jgi:hypothetical protein
MKIDEISPAVTGARTPQMRMRIEKRRPNLCFLESWECFKFKREGLNHQILQELFKNLMLESKLTSEDRNKSARKFHG